ncbi:Spliceosome RNA helicase ddx39b [Podila humilis]|nr:Spliceosome RNA helicase ddx39b [Podila humilis]
MNHPMTLNFFGPVCVVQNVCYVEKTDVDIAVISIHSSDSETDESRADIGMADQDDESDHNECDRNESDHNESDHNESINTEPVRAEPVVVEPVVVEPDNESRAQQEAEFDEPVFHFQPALVCNSSRAGDFDGDSVVDNSVIPVSDLALRSTNPNIPATLAEANGLFHNLGLRNELLYTLATAQITALSRVQKTIMPLALAEMDIICSAAPSEGKTASFIIATLENHSLVPAWNQVTVLVLVPSAEAVDRVEEKYRHFGCYLPNLRLAVAKNVHDLRYDQRILRDTDPSIVISTPCRIVSLLNQGAIQVDKIKTLVIDQCDLIMAQEDVMMAVEYIAAKTPAWKQTIATAISLNARAKQALLGITRQCPIEVDDTTHSHAPEEDMDVCYRHPLQNCLVVQPHVNPVHPMIEMCHNQRLSHYRQYGHYHQSN